MKLTTRCIAAWIACLAIVFAALAPSVSHALAMSGGASWTEVCTPDGAKLMKLAGDQAEPADPAAGKSHLEHCQFCATHGGASTLPPSAAVVLQLLELSDPLPVLFYQAARPLPIWTVAQSRAPPMPA